MFSLLEKSSDRLLEKEKDSPLLLMLLLFLFLSLLLLLLLLLLFLEDNDHLVFEKTWQGSKRPMHP